MPVFALRTGIRRYEIHVIGRFDPRTRADSVATMVAAVKAYEGIVRSHPEQWLMFEKVWGGRSPDTIQDDVRSAVG